MKSHSAIWYNSIRSKQTSELGRPSFLGRISYIGIYEDYMINGCISGTSVDLEANRSNISLIGVDTFNTSLIGKNGLTGMSRKSRFSRAQVGNIG